ncbi:hypothetical protein AB8U03_00020 [Clostridium sp. Mt-5]|uniref:Uncharacterized protein n=1 Tax=Clostridium moutaii TaxID=3240932 RepID=A0ABV4BIH8_9CLOT
MPLHIVPLCNFRYAGDVYSGATFEYDTTGKIFKAERLKLLRESTIKEIEKSKENKLLRSVWNKSIVKNSSKLLRRNNYDVSKSIFKCLKAENRGININPGISLEEFRNIILNIDRSIELGNTNDIIINVECSKSLEDAGFTEFELERNKNLQESKDKQISRNDSLVHFNRENLLFNLIINDTYMHKLSEKPMDKNKSIIFTLSYKIRFIGKSSEKYFDRVYFIQTFLYENKSYERYDIKNISKYNQRFVDRIALKHMDYRDAVFSLKREVLRNIFMSYRLINLDRVTIKKIFRNLKTKLLRKDNRRNLSVIVDNYGLDRLVVNHIFKDISKLFIRYTEKNIYFDYSTLLNREIITKINKMQDKYLKGIGLINIYRQTGKSLSGATVLNIFENESRSLGSFNRDLYKEVNNNKFIEITKRWWWLNSTDPRDNLIIPNMDFSYNEELLNNSYYEYLRFTNHPIGWGNTWGIDWNIPAYAVSIEIMLDLVNILIMTWHDNVQGWLCCSGKESMQFIMELLYDWYTLDILKPNADYYRAYRWIRWEAEKVYFLNLDNGLQAVGLLIANLIDYLKRHHFNLVPLWRNSKAMDIERNFNRMAQNSDLMKALNKAKGKRYYYLETQNIEKKNILGDGGNGSNS